MNIFSDNTKCITDIKKNQLVTYYDINYFISESKNFIWFFNSVKNHFFMKKDEFNKKYLEGEIKLLFSDE